MLKGLLLSFKLCAALNHKIRYRLHRQLGPVKIPNQNMRFPNVFRPRSHLVRLSLTSYEIRGQQVY